MSENENRANKTDAGNGSYGICRVIDASRSPSPDPKRSAKEMTTLKTAIACRSVAVRLVAFLVLAYIVYVSWHERFGRFMFFEEMDPPAADPHRKEHLRDAYYMIYGTLGLILGLLAAVRARIAEAIITIVIGIGLFLSLRYRGIPAIFDPASEEGYYGVRAIAVASLILMTIALAVRGVWPRLPNQTTQAEQGGGGQAATRSESA